MSAARRSRSRFNRVIVRTGRSAPEAARTRPVVRPVLGLLTCLGLLLGGQVVLAGPASAGQVGVTISIRGSGYVEVVEGSIEDGGSTTCSWLSNKDDRVTNSCARIRNEEAFEAWVWLRPTASNVPAGNWQFTGWQGCDQTRTGADGVTECAVHSGLANAVERTPLAVFEDNVAPSITALAETFSTSQERTASFAFASNESGTTECRFDAELYDTCTSGISRTFSEGSHSIHVRATDPSGNVSQTSSRTFTVVDTAITGGPFGLTNSRTPTFTYSTLAGIAFECSLDSSAFGPCPNSGRSYFNLSDGMHTFEVRARNGEWWDRVPATRTWMIDGTPPNTFLNSTNTSGTSASFSFGHGGGGTGFDCRLLRDGTLFSDWQPCNTGSRSYSSLPDGAWTFEVRARDQAGNVDPTPAAHEWTLDTTAPQTSVLAGPVKNAFVLSTAADLSFGSTEPGSSFTCAVDGAAVDCPGGSLSLTNLSHTTHTATSVATDGTGNTDASPARRSWTVPLDNTELTHGTGWTQKSTRGAYLGTYSQSAVQGATLTRNVTNARKVALVVTKGVGYGKVQVFAGTELLKTVGLAATTRKTKQVIPIPKFATAFTGELRIVVLTAGKTVRIEGLGVAT